VALCGGVILPMRKMARKKEERQVVWRYEAKFLCGIFRPDLAGSFLVFHPEGKYYDH
jgi:hypothetical protein